MKLVTQREVDPELRLDGMFVVTAADFAILKLTEDQFYEIFGPEWQKQSMTAQLAVLTRFASVLENHATSLNLTAGPPEPK